MPSNYFPVDHPTTSYWLVKPHRLAHYRSSSQVPERCDVAIVGTGLAGVSTAYHILQQSEAKGEPSPKIVLLEARDACSGATGRNGGHIKAGMPGLKAVSDGLGAVEVDRLVAWVADQRYEIKATAEKEGIECDMLLTRSYDVYFDQDQANTVRNWITAQRDSGATWVKDIQWLEGPNLERIVGVKGLAAAVGIPVLSLSPYKFVTGLLEKVVSAGALLYTNTLVTSAAEDTHENGASTTILSTERGVMRAEKVIFATNGYSASLLSQYRDVIAPIKGQACQLVARSPKHHDLNLATTYNLYYSSTYVDYMNPRPDGTIVIGGGSKAFRSGPDDRNPSWFGTVDDSDIINEEVSEHFGKVMATYFRSWQECEAGVNIAWSGIMGYTPDGLPHAGRVPGCRSQWILAAFNGGGMAMIFTLARAVATMATDGVEFESTNIPAFFKTTSSRLSNKFSN